MIREKMQNIQMKRVVILSIPYVQIGLSERGKASDSIMG